MLLVQRVMEPERGKWSLPAGFIDDVDDPVATAIREVKEETGLDVAIDGLIDVYHTVPATKGALPFFLLYRGYVTGGTLQAGDDAAAAQFFGRDELPDIAFESTRQMVQRYLQNDS